MNNIWLLNIDDYLEIYDLAKKNGKKEGDNMQEEMLFVMNKKNVSPIAKTNNDLDLLCGNLREQGIKVLNLKEKIREEKDGEI